MKITVYIATSLDGFIARPDGDIEWLHNPDYVLADGNDMGFGALMESIDYLVMGSGSYEKVRSFDIPWPYEKPVIVLSSRPQDIPAELASKVSQMAGDPAEIVQSLKAQGAQHIYLDGGKTVQDFLSAGLVSELIITQIPILLGEGIPLFGPLPADIHLSHQQTQSYANGMVQSHYLVR